MTHTPYPDVYFSRQDETDDRQFYAVPRKVVHLDDAAIATLRDTVFSQTLADGDAVLDLMSSWRSHLPDSTAFARVTGLGMNADEMMDNPQLTEAVVHDLNQSPELPFANATFDAVICTVSVQYLVRPVDVFSEVRRVLKPGGAFIVSFSNRCFPDKAVWVWLFTDDEKHQALVSDYFRRAGFVKIAATAYEHDGGDPLFVVKGHRSKR
jgi:SAM-dependent methyltransferase